MAAKKKSYAPADSVQRGLGAVPDRLVKERGAGVERGNEFRKRVDEVKSKMKGMIPGMGKKPMPKPKQMPKEPAMKSLTQAGIDSTIANADRILNRRRKK